MRQVYGYWRAEIARNWIIAGVLVVWCINASMNGLMGWDTGDGIMAPLYAGVFVSIALCGAYAATVLEDADGLRWYLLGVLVVAQLCLGQMAGWQTLGLTLDRGLAKHESQATTRSVVKNRLQRLRDERRALGTITVPIASLRAKLALEARKTSRRYKDGRGPEYTKLADQLAVAEKAAELDAKIKAEALAFQDGPKVRSANVLFEVPAVLASKLATWWWQKEKSVSQEDVRFAFLVFLVALLEFVATLGFWLFRASKPAPIGPEAMLDPAQLPAPEAPAAITNDNAYGALSEAPPAAPLVPQSPQMAPAPGAGPPGGGATNIINVGSHRVAQVLPPRVAARRAGV